MAGVSGAGVEIAGDGVPVAVGSTGVTVGGSIGAVGREATGVRVGDSTTKGEEVAVRLKVGVRVASGVGVGVAVGTDVAVVAESVTVRTLVGVVLGVLVRVGVERTNVPVAEATALGVPRGSVVALGACVAVVVLEGVRVADEPGVGDNVAGPGVAVDVRTFAGTFVMVGTTVRVGEASRVPVAGGRVAVAIVPVGVTAAGTLVGVGVTEGRPPAEGSKGGRVGVLVGGASRPGDGVDVGTCVVGICVAARVSVSTASGPGVEVLVARGSLVGDASVPGVAEGDGRSVGGGVRTAGPNTGVAVTGPRVTVEEAVGSAVGERVVARGLEVGPAVVLNGTSTPDGSFGGGKAGRPGTVAGSLVGTPTNAAVTGPSSPGSSGTEPGGGPEATAVATSGPVAGSSVRPAVIWVGEAGE